MALEVSGSVGEASGWIPNHLVVYCDQQLVAAMPVYEKQNSYGEYVFDFEWANAFHQNGLHYYPKLVTSIPFTPCSGARLNIHPEHRQSLVPLIADKLRELCASRNLSSWHLLFPDLEFQNDLQPLTKQANEPINNTSLLRRIGIQYHWYNRGYQSFEDFLSQCKPKKRKNMRRERRAIEQADVQLDFVEGEQANGELWMQFFHFYQRTYIKRSGHGGYLNWAFFETIANSMADRVVFVTAKHQNKLIGMSLFFKSPDTLYGRYWGASAEYDFLHFEACYYQGIDYCIKHNIAHFDAGAQGEHKIQRGFEPIETCSYHWIVHPQFRNAIEDFLTEETKQLKAIKKELAERLPFKS